MTSAQSPHDQPSDRIGRLLRLASRLTGRAAQRSERVERWLLLLAIIVFVVAAVTALQRVSIDAGQFRPGVALAAAGLATVTLLANALEFTLSARVLGRTIPRQEAIRVSVLSSAANVLPIPGAVLIRTRALHQLGEGLRGAVTVTTGIGIAWVAAAGLLAGALLAATSARLLGAGIFGFSVVAAGLAIAVVAYGAEQRPSARWVALLWIVELASVLLSGLRLYLIAAMVGLQVGFIDAMAVNLGGILSHVAGIFPGGLGIKELSSGIFASLVGLEVSVGVLLAVFDRVLTYLVLSVVVVALLWRDPSLRASFKRTAPEHMP